MHQRVSPTQTAIQIYIIFVVGDLLFRVLNPQGIKTDFIFIALKTLKTLKIFNLFILQIIQTLSFINIIIHFSFYILYNFYD